MAKTKNNQFTGKFKAIDRRFGLSLFYFAFAASSLFLFIARQTPAQNLEALTSQIKSGNVEQKREALFQIRNLESADASGIAVPALRDDSEIIRATAAFSVIFLPKNEAAQFLIPNLQDKSELVRRETAYALGKVGEASAVSRLLQTLRKDKVREVRAASAIALGEIGDVSAIGDLIAILRKKPSEDEEFLRRSAARAIGQTAQIVQTERQRVLTPENFLPERYKDLQPPKFLRLTSEFPVFVQAASALKNVLQNDAEADDARREAAFSLGAIGDETAISLLQSKSSDADYYLAEISKEALRKIEFLELLRNNKNK